MNKWIVLMATITAAGLMGCTHDTGHGEKVGSVIKVAQEGLLFKTNEVEIVRGGMNGGSGSFSTTPLNATINDPGLLAKVKDALDKQYEVRVTYQDYLWTPLSSDSSSRYLTGIEPMPKTTAVPVAKEPLTNRFICVPEASLLPERNKQ